MEGMADISKIIGVIMENPDLIEKIKELAAGTKNENTETEKKTADVATEPSDTMQVSHNAKTDSATEAAAPILNTKKRRHDLLCAIKPYVSEGRGKAIDTMLSVIEVLDIVKAR